MTFTRALATNNYGPAKFIVDGTTTANGTHSTIAAALTSASSGDTIFIRPGTYTENLTLKAGVALTAFQCDAEEPNVIISGKCTFTAAGAVVISGIRLQTNSDFCLAVTGSAASVVKLIGSRLQCSNNTGVSYTSSDPGSGIKFFHCTGDLATTGIGYFTATGAGSLDFQYCYMLNSGNSTTTSTTSACPVSLQWSNFSCTFATSSTGTFGISYTAISPGNNTSLTTAGTGGATCHYSNFSSGSASSISIGTGTTVNLYGCEILSSNTNAITGAGTINYNGLLFSSTSKTINTTTQTSVGTLFGSTTTAPTAGMLGEQIRSFLAGASAVTLTNNTAANITSISLTAGIWDVSCVGAFQAAAITGVDFCISISTTSATRGTGGDNEIETPIPPTSSANNMLSIPSFRITLSATTTVYLVGFATFSVGTLKAFGRIAGTRVG